MENVLYLLIVADALTLVALMHLWFIQRKNQMEARLLFGKMVTVVEAQKDFNEVVVHIINGQEK